MRPLVKTLDSSTDFDRSSKELQSENLRLMEKMKELTDTLDEVMAENGVLNHRYNVKTEELDSTQTELGDIVNKLEQVSKEKQETEAELVKLRKNEKNKRNDLAKTVQNSCKVLQEKLEQLQKEKEDTMANNTCLSDENITFIDLLHRKEEELTALTHMFGTMSQELNVERETRVELENNLDEERQTIKVKVSQLTNKMKQFKTEKDDLEAKLQEATHELETKEQNYKAQIEGRNRAFRAELDQLKQANNEVTEEKDILFDRYSACLRLLDSREQEINEVRQTAAELVLERKELSAELETLRNEITKIKEDQAAATDPNVSLDEEMTRCALAREKVTDEKSLVAMKVAKISLRKEIEKQLCTKYESAQSTNQATKESSNHVELAALTELFYNDIVVMEEEIKTDDMKKDLECVKEDHGPFGFIFMVGDFVKSVVPLPLPF